MSTSKKQIIDSPLWSLADENALSIGAELLTLSLFVDLVDNFGKM